MTKNNITAIPSVMERLIISRTGILYSQRILATPKQITKQNSDHPYYGMRFYHIHFS
jgi:hypothetical protein